MTFDRPLPAPWPLAMLGKPCRLPIELQSSSRPLICCRPSTGALFEVTIGFIKLYDAVATT